MIYVNLKLNLLFNILKIQNYEVVSFIAKIKRF